MTVLADTEPTLRRRDRQRHQTRRDLALAAFDLASAGGLSNVRVPDIAAAIGVSTRTFNNYFSCKEEAIAWPARQRAEQMARNLASRPTSETLSDALVTAVCELYKTPQDDGLPADWLSKFRQLVAAEPSLHGEYLKASDAAERALGEAIAQRIRATDDALQPRVVAAMVIGAERAAVRHWMQRASREKPLVETVRVALQEAVAGVQV